MLILLQNNKINLKNNQLWGRYRPISGYFDLIVNNGDGDGRYVDGSTVSVSGTGSGTFNNWTGDTATIESLTSEVTNVTLTGDVEITANYLSLDNWNNNMNEYDGDYQ